MEFIEYMTVDRVVDGKLVEEQDNVEVKFNHKGEVTGLAIYNEKFDKYFDLPFEKLGKVDREIVEEFVADRLFQYELDFAWAK